MLEVNRSYYEQISSETLFISDALGKLNMSYRCQVLIPTL